MQVVTNQPLPQRFPHETPPIIEKLQLAMQFKLIADLAIAALNSSPVRDENVVLVLRNEYHRVQKLIEELETHG